MQQVNVLIVADVEGALASGDLGSNVYLIDTNKHAGSGNEGQEELYTACRDGQIITWNVVGVSPSSDVEITQFTGAMVNNNICNPTQVSAPGDVFWQGRVEARLSPGGSEQSQYSVVLTMDGRPMTFDPFLKISRSS